MREIKFRGYSLELGKWIYGQVMKDKHGAAYIVGNVVESNEEYINFEFWRPVKWLGQMTGLKDKNGKEIYEGDIVQHYLGVKGTVLWSVDSGWWTFKETDTSESLLASMQPVEIIGNIYESKELLEKK